jgi:Type II secretion system (T2SS), protein E, N-terminal domain
MEQFGDRHTVATTMWEGVREGEQSSRPSLARLLQDEGLATRDQVEQALAEGERTGERLGEVLLRWRLVDEQKLGRLLARQWQLPFLEENEVAPEESALAALSAEDARRTGAVPVRWEDGVLRVVVAEPTDERLAEARACLPQEAAFAVVTPGALYRLLARLDVPATEASPAPAESAHAPPAEPGQGLNELISLLDGETAHLQDLREKVQQFTALVAARDQAVERLQHELEAARASREQALITINRLRADVEQRDRLLALVSTKINELGSTLESGRA